MNPERIYLFGSRAKGNATYYSDFDFEIEASAPEIERLEQLKEKIDEVSGLYSIDIVFMKDVEIEFADIIKKWGLLFMRDDIATGLKKLKDAFNKLK